MSKNPTYNELQRRAAQFGVTPNQLIRALIRQDNKTICKAIFADMDWPEQNKNEEAKNAVV